jgi:hypothetical protein
MAKADRVYITPPTNTSAIDHPMMFPLVDPTRRRFLATAAVASVVGSGSLAAAAMAPDVPHAVTVPIGQDPIYDVIEQQRKAAREHIEAVRIECAFEEAHDIHGEQREEYQRLSAASGTAYDAKYEAGFSLVNTRPTTLAGIPVRRGRSAGSA